MSTRKRIAQRCVVCDGSFEVRPCHLGKLTTCGSDECKRERKKMHSGPSYWSGRTMTQETRLKMSESAKLRIARGDVKVVGNRRSSKIERSIAEYVESDGYVHTDGSGFRIVHEGRTKFPDYVDLDQRRVLEVWGDYWHRGQDPQELIDWYHSAGWSCRVVWESEVKDFLKIARENRELGRALVW